MTRYLGLSGEGFLAPSPEIGPWRKNTRKALLIISTLHPSLLRLFGDFRSLAYRTSGNYRQPRTKCSLNNSLFVLPILPAIHETHSQRRNEGIRNKE